MVRNRTNANEMKRVHGLIGIGTHILSQGEMKRTFRSNHDSLLPLAEKLRGLDPKKDRKEYQQTLNAYLRSSESN